MLVWLFVVSQKKKEPYLQPHIVSKCNTPICVPISQKNPTEKWSMHLGNKYINDQHWAIRREFEPVGPTVLENPLGARWGLLPTLQWVGSWLPTYLPSFFPSSREKISQRELNRQPLHSENAYLSIIIG